MKQVALVWLLRVLIQIGARVPIVLLLVDRDGSDRVGANRNLRLASLTIGRRLCAAHLVGRFLRVVASILAAWLHMMLHKTFVVAEARLWGAHLWSRPIGGRAKQH